MPNRTRRPTGVANSIRSLREERGLSVEALAQATGVHVTQVRRWERGAGGMLFDNALRLAAVLHTTVGSLMAEPPPRPNRIRELRVAQGLSGVDLAARLGVAQSQVSLWESGRNALWLESAVAIAAALGVAVEELAVASAPVESTPVPAGPSPERVEQRERLREGAP